MITEAKVRKCPHIVGTFFYLCGDIDIVKPIKNEKKMEKMMIQEPCCIENTLPRLLTKGETTVWQTNGDVTFDKVMKTVSYLAGNEIRVKVVTPTFTLRMAQVMAWMWRRGWLKRLDLLTKNAVGDDVMKTLGDEIAENGGYVVEHRNVKEGMVVIEGESATVVVIGDLLSEVDAGLRNYVTYWGTNKAKVEEMTAGAMAMMMTAAKKKEKARLASETRENGGSLEEDYSTSDGDVEGREAGEGAVDGGV